MVYKIYIIQKGYITNRIIKYHFLLHDKILEI